MLKYQHDCNMNYKYDITLDGILDASAGIITSAQAQSAGVLRPAFARYIKRRGLKRAAKGIYLDTAAFLDEMLLLQLRFPKAIFSYTSALYLHDMCDQEPMPLFVTVDSNYNASSLKEQGICVHYIKPEWYKLGITEVKTPSGAKVKAYDKERTICDIVRKRAKVDPAVFKQAIRSYARSKDKNLVQLSFYAQKMNIEASVYEIMEVAL